MRKRKVRQGQTYYMPITMPRSGIIGFAVCQVKTVTDSQVVYTYDNDETFCDSKERFLKKHCYSKRKALSKAKMELLTTTRQ